MLRSEVRHLLCLMSNNNVPATDELIDLLTRRVSAAVEGHLCNPDLVSTVLTVWFFTVFFCSNNQVTGYIQRYL